MTQQERKQHSEDRLKSIGIVLNEELPVTQEEQALVPRSAQEIAERIVILTYLNVSATDHSLRQQVMMFLIYEKLWDKATEEEKEWFHKVELTEEDLNQIFSTSESIWALLWGIQKINELNLPNESADLHEMFPLLPGFLESTTDFVQNAVTRDLAEVLREYDFLFRLNWALQDDVEGNVTVAIDRRIAYERFTALDWIISGTETYQYH